MTIVDLAITWSGSQTEFKSPPGGRLLNSLHPMGLQWFTGNTAIVAKIATNETHIRGTMSFPAQYAYCLKSFNIAVRLTLGTTNNFEPEGLVELQLGVAVGGQTEQYFPIHNQGISYEFKAAVAADPTRAYVLDRPIAQLIPGGSTMRVLLADEDAGATNAGVLIASFCFYRYAIEQLYAMELNTALPILSIG